MQTTQLAPQSCPSCHKVLSACSNMTGATGPAAGDVTVCINCAAVLQFGPDLSLTAVSVLVMDPESMRNLLRVRKAVQLTIAQRASMN